MKEKAEQFIIMRAEGHSYSKIAKELGISKSTCTAWNAKYRDQIAELESEELKELKARYRITKAGYIERIGQTLQKIDNAIATADFSTVPADKLLKLKLEYEERLQAEYSPEDRQEDTQPYTAEEIVAETQQTYNRLKKGEISPQTARTLLYTLEGINRTQAVADNNTLVTLDFQRAE